jgi:hypothetical protein
LWRAAALLNRSQKPVFAIFFETPKLSHKNQIKIISLIFIYLATFSQAGMGFAAAIVVAERDLAKCKSSVSSAPYTNQSSSSRSLK